MNNYKFYTQFDCIFSNNVILLAKTFKEVADMKKILSAAAAVAGAAVILAGAAGCDNTDKIYVDTNAYFAPFEYIDENGGIAGVDVDIMKLVGEKLGKEVVFTNTEFNVNIDNVASGNQLD